ncbi:MAG: DDE-type integrase/transposase/recombinase [Firmicutes bacterium]|nr:DDE-type integrase/transposase/recombinase [Bacillota bacterium]
MKKNSLWKSREQIIRVLDVKNEKVFVIDCVKRTMPYWVIVDSLSGYEEYTESEMIQRTGAVIPDIEKLDAESRRFIREHFTMIAPVLPFVSDMKQRTYIINQIAAEKNVSKQTIRNYLCLYLVYQNEVVFCPKQKEEKELTEDEKNMRWGLNKFYYNQHKNSLSTAYTLLLRAKYCDESGRVLPEHPSVNQFRYFEKKYRKRQNYYISRNGLKDYQKNHRPLLGDGIQEFAPHVGVGMLDATVCDIYLVNDAGELIGRPILTACIDAYSGLCCGYSLTWEGGTYSLRGLMLNVIEDKKEHCKKFGIQIQKEDWHCDKMPATLVTDMGSEYVSSTFEQIAELGVTLINLPAYRPELKGSVEKFFDLIQGYFKPILKGKGIIEPDFKQRGSHDYRKDACLTLYQFEQILLRCILFYNSKRIIENYPYTESMIREKVLPTSCSIWDYGLRQASADLLDITSEELILTLLPRTEGRFTRQGLKVNGMRYRHDNYTEKYLAGGTATVAYNPENTSYVWLLENGSYILFELIESRYRNKNLEEVESIKTGQKAVVKAFAQEQTQAQIDLVNHIEMIAFTTDYRGQTKIKGIRENRQKEQIKAHKDYMKVGV